MRDKDKLKNNLKTKLKHALFTITITEINDNVPLRASILYLPHNLFIACIIKINLQRH